MPKNPPFDPTDTGDLIESIGVLAETLAHDDVACEVGPSFNCGEAEMIAKVLVLAGYRNEAAEWLSGHGVKDDNDEEGQDDGFDLHGHLHHVDDRGVEVRNIDLARGYVDRRWPRD